jgi:branched-chain amino acid transport system ATP-binding protein
MLEVRDLHLSFGGIKALQGVSFAAHPPARSPASSARTAPARPSCSTRFPASTGPIGVRSCSKGNDITSLSPDRRAELGIARTFQNIALFRGMTVLDNIKLGGHTRLQDRALVGAALFRGGPARGARTARARSRSG